MRDVPIATEFFSVVRELGRMKCKSDNVARLNLYDP